MKLSKSLMHGLLALSLGLAAVPVVADDDCEVPIEHWQSREAVLQMAAREGWQVQSLKIDDGCYKIRGKDTGGRAFKATIDPQTLDVVTMKLRDHDGERDRDLGREDSAPRDHGATTPGDNRLFTPDTAPRGQIE